MCVGGGYVGGRVMRECISGLPGDQGGPPAYGDRGRGTVSPLPTEDVRDITRFDDLA